MKTRLYLLSCLNLPSGKEGSGCSFGSQMQASLPMAAHTCWDNPGQHHTAACSLPSGPGEKEGKSKSRKTLCSHPVPVNSRHIGHRSMQKQGMEENALTISIVEHHMAALDSGSYWGSRNFTKQILIIYWFFFG